MPRNDPIEQALDRLSSLRSAQDGALEKEIGAFLRNRSNLVIAKAAKIVRERKLNALVPDLVAAFQKLMADPARLDKRCAALTEIVETLYAFDYTEPDVYLKGLRHVQMEPSFGPPVDAAAHLRGWSALGLARTKHRDALALIVNLLVDPQPPARIGAIRAFAVNGGEAGVLALRLKVLTGDREPEVISECFSGLLLSGSETSVEFVGQYVDAEDAPIAEASILALGAARSPKAVRILTSKWEGAHGALKKFLLLALSESRNEDALNFLVAELASAPVSIAGEILKALAAQRPSASIRQTIKSAVNSRRDEALRTWFDSAFPT